MLGIIPAAGRGIRFKELGKNYSKTILPYKEKPILIHQIEWLEQHGCDEIRVVLNHAEDSVKDILKFYNKKVTICRQDERNGLAGAVLAADRIEDGDKNVLIILGDLVAQEEIPREMFNKNFIAVKEVQDYSRWCMVELDGRHVKRFIDKPTERPATNLSVSGVYHFTSSTKLFTLLSKQLSDPANKISDEFQMSTTMGWIAAEEKIFTINLKMIDFGTLEEYLTNRDIKISRSFNDIQINGPFVTKSSHTKGEKLIAEYNWFMNLPDAIQVHTPRIFHHDFYDGSVYYKMEKVLAPSLREVYLFLDSTEETWSNIFDALFGLLADMRNYGQPNDFAKSVVSKTRARLKDIDIPIENKLVNQFIDELQESTSKIQPKYCLMHGDFCFSNLLYDFQANEIIMIDPRGELFGDHYYEVAKICHSIMFDYDFVDAELYVKEGDSYKLYNNGKEKIKQLFKDKLFEKYTKDEVRHILMLTASLFLSMIPLHSHNVNNQKIYYDIFKWIYGDLKGK